VPITRFCPKSSSASAEEPKNKECAFAN